MSRNPCALWPGVEPARFRDRAGVNGNRGWSLAGGVVKISSKAGSHIDLKVHGFLDMIKRIAIFVFGPKSHRHRTPATGRGLLVTHRVTLSLLECSAAGEKFGGMKKGQ